MAGYNYKRGMSNNAVDAYRRNLKPISRFTAQDLCDADINISLAFAKWLAKKKYWKHVERHHSSKFCNMVRIGQTQSHPRCVRRHPPPVFSKAERLHQLSPIA